MESEQRVYVVFRGRPQIFHGDDNPDLSLTKAQAYAAAMCDKTRETWTVMQVTREEADKTLEARWHGVVIHAGEEE